MAFENTVPVWNAPGAEPPDTLKNTGFQAGYKPPADYFNWFWNRTSRAVKELQDGAIFGATLDKVDLNTMTETGIYGYALSCTNTPTNNSGALIVQNYRTSWLVQLAVVHGSGVIFTRFSNNAAASWTAWNEFYSANNFSAPSNVLQDHGEIEDGTNMNDLTELGVYYASKSTTAASLSNCPTEKAFYLEVGKHAGTYQRIVEFRGADPKIYFRNYYYETGWGAWHREYSTTDKPTGVDISAHDLANVGTEVTNSANLNSYTTPGNYYVGSATVAATLTNTPITGSGFRLLVERGYLSGYTRQYAVGVGGAIWTRYYQTSWSAWVRLYNSGDTPANMGAASASHTHAASEVKAGTFAGQVVANSSGQSYSTYLLRNQKLSATEEVPTVNGSICWQYE